MWLARPHPVVVHCEPVRAVVPRVEPGAVVVLVEQADSVVRAHQQVDVLRVRLKGDSVAEPEEDVPVEQQVQIGLQQLDRPLRADPCEDGARHRVGGGEGRDRHHLDAGQVTRKSAEQETAALVAVDVRPGALVGVPDPTGEAGFGGGDPVEQCGDCRAVGE